MSRKNWAAAATLIVTVAGLAVTAALLVEVGFGDVVGVVRRIGWAGFAAYTAYTFVILALLGSAWFLLGGQGMRLAVFVWARTTREAATDVLPFSQFGGIVVGARSLIARGVPTPVVYASLVADQTVELAAQLVYTIYGVAMLALILGGAPGRIDVLGPALAGLGVSVAVIIAFAFAQRPLLEFGARTAGAILPGSANALTGVREALDATYRRKRPLIAAFALHLAAWVGSGAGAWIALRLIGVEIGAGQVIVIESLIFTLRTAAFLVPGAIGLQEGAYVLIGPLFGLPPEAALALSLLKRARDLAIGVPVMAVWQLAEGRSLISRGAKS